MRLTLPSRAVIDVTVFDIRGAKVRTIANGLYLEGAHTIGWDGRTASGESAAPGIYFARVSGAGQTATQKIQLVR